MQKRRKDQIRQIAKEKSIAALHRHLILRCTGLFPDFILNKNKTSQSNPCLQPTVPTMAKSVLQKLQTASSTASCSPFMIQVAEINERPLTVSKKRLILKHKKQEIYENQKKYIYGDSNEVSQIFETQKSFNIVKFNSLTKQTILPRSRESRIHKYKTQQGEILKNDRIKQKFWECKAKTENDSTQKDQNKQNSRPWSCQKSRNKQRILNRGKVNKRQLFGRHPLFKMQQIQSGEFNAWDVESNEASQF